MPVLTRTAVTDADAASNGNFKATPASLDIGNNPSAGAPDSWAAIQFDDVQIDRYSKINSASFSLYMFGAPQVDVTYHSHLFAAINPTFPTDAPSLRDPARTAAFNTHTIPATAVNGWRNWGLAAALQEIVNRPDWVKGGRIVVVLKGETANTPRTLHYSESNSSPTYRQTLTADFTPPVTGSGTTSAPAQTTTGTGSSENPATTGSGSAAAPDQTTTGSGSSDNPPTTGSGSAAAPDQTAIGTAATEGEPPFTGDGQVVAPEQTAGGEGSSDNPAVSGEGTVSSPSPTATGTALTYLSPPQLDGPLTVSPQSELANAVARHMLGLLPPGRKPKEGGYAYFVVLALAALTADLDEAAIQMVLDWSPSRTQNPELLARIGEGRGIKRGAGEPFGAYRARVVNAADFWKLGGTVAGVKAALETAGYGVKITEHYYTDRRRWAEFSVELYPRRGEFTADTWDDGNGSWDDGSRWDWGISNAEAARIGEIIREMKAAHSKVRSAFYQSGGPQDFWNDDIGGWDDQTSWHGFDPIQII